jgi:ribose/xylose/arabinose/galactoside ABC-type transport system permease subunit
MVNMNRKEFYKEHIRPLLHHKAFVLVLILVGLVALFSIWSLAIGRNFLIPATPRNILNSLVLPSFLAIGAGCLLIGGHIDLSAWAIGAFGGMVVATGIVGWGIPWWLAIVLCLLLCAFFGAVNATLVSFFRFPAFIGTLAMGSVANGLMYLFSTMGREDGRASNIAIHPEHPVIAYIGQGRIGQTGFFAEIPFGVVVMLIFMLVYGVMLAKTKLGMKIMLMGGNPVSARLAGINSRKLTYFLFINSAVMGGIAGVFNTARLGQGQLLALQTSQFAGITAAILGGISFGGGAGGMGGAFVGLLILQTFQIGMSVVRVNPFWVTVFTGVMLILALAIDFLAQMRKNKALV